MMKEFRATASELNLKESWTAYRNWGKGPKRPLRFSKSGDAQIERRYATHYVKTRPLEQAEPVQGSDEA
jgi:hypothetical protein